MRTSDSAAEVVPVVRLWAETTAQTTSSYGGCERARCSPALACPPARSLPVFPGHMQPLSRVSKQGHTVWALSHLCGNIPGRILPARPRPPLTAGTRVEMWGLPRTFVPGASTKDIAGPGPHWAGKAMCNMWRDFWGRGEAKGQHPFLCTVFMLLFR